MDNRTKFKFNDLDVSSVLLTCCKKSYSTLILSTFFKNTFFNVGMTKAHLYGYRFVTVRRKYGRSKLNKLKKISILWHLTFLFSYSLRKCIIYNLQEGPFLKHEIRIISFYFCKRLRWVKFNQFNLNATKPLTQKYKFTQFLLLLVK